MGERSLCIQLTIARPQVVFDAVVCLFQFEAPMAIIYPSFLWGF